MSVTVGDLLVKLSLENAQYKSELEKSRQQTQRDTDFMSKGAELVGKAWKVAGPVIVSSLTAAGAAIVKSIDLASDLDETTSKTAVVFGTAADDILDFSTTTAGALGQTQQQALDAASTFGIFGKSAGLAGADLSDFAIDLTTLASDLASFHNASPEEAITAIGAALRGETEPMRRFGVLLDDATLKAKAMEMGLISTTSNALTPQQKVLAAYNVIMAQTVDAQGDFARTSDGLANTQRVLKAELTDLATEWGTALLPIVQEFASEAVPTLIDGLQVMTDSHLPAFVELVGRAADAMLTAFDAGMLLITLSDRLDMALAEQETNLLNNTKSYDEYVKGIVNAQVAAGEYGEYVGAHIIGLLGDEGTKLAEVAAQRGFLTEAEYEAIQAGMELGESEDKLNIIHTNYKTSTQEAATATGTLNTNSTLLKDALVGLAADGFTPATVAANLLKEGINLVTNSAVEAQQVTMVLAIAEKMRQLNTEDLTEAQQKQLSAELELMLNQQSELQNISQLNQLYQDGKITKLDWIAAMADQKVTTEELNALIGTTNEALSEEEERLLGVNEEMGDHGVGAMTDFEEKMWELGEPLLETTEAVGMLADETQTLVTGLNAIKPTYNTKIIIEMDGSVPQFSGIDQGHTTSTGNVGFLIADPGAGTSTDTGIFDPFATLMGNSSLGFATTSGKLAGTFAGMLGNEDAKARLDALDKEIELASSYDERLWLEQQRADLVKEIAANEEKVAALKEKQQDMAFLQSQLELVKLAKETGADIGQFAGKLGKDASIEDLLTATTDIFDQMVNQANDALLGWGIAGDGGQGAWGEPRKSGRGGGRGRFGDPRGDKGGGGATAFGGSFGGGGDKSGSGVERFGFGGPGSGLQMAGGGKWIHIEHLYVQADDAMSLVEQLYELAD